MRQERRGSNASMPPECRRRPYSTPTAARLVHCFTNHGSIISISQVRERSSRPGNCQGQCVYGGMHCTVLRENTLYSTSTRYETYSSCLAAQSFRRRCMAAHLPPCENLSRLLAWHPLTTSILILRAFA